MEEEKKTEDKEQRSDAAKGRRRPPSKLIARAANSCASARDARPQSVKRAAVILLMESCSVAGQ